MKEELFNIFQGETATFTYNHDFSGNVVIENLGSTMEVNAKDILKFVADTYVRPRLLSCIQATPVKDLLLNQINPLEPESEDPDKYLLD